MKAFTRNNISIQIQDAFSYIENDKTCPYLRKCIWRGHVSELYDHLNKYHNIEVMKSVSTNVLIKIKLDNDENITKVYSCIFQSDNCDFLIVSRIKYTQKYTMVSCYCVNITNNSENNIFDNEKLIYCVFIEGVKQEKCGRVITPMNIHYNSHNCAFRRKFRKSEENIHMNITIKHCDIGCPVTEKKHLPIIFENNCDSCSSSCKDKNEELWNHVIVSSQ